MCQLLSGSRERNYAQESHYFVVVVATTLSRSLKKDAFRYASQIWTPKIRCTIDRIRTVSNFETEKASNDYRRRSTHAFDLRSIDISL